LSSLSQSWCGRGSVELTRAPGLHAHGTAPFALGNGVLRLIAASSFGRVGQKWASDATPRRAHHRDGDRRRAGVSVEAVGRPYSAPELQGYRATPRQRTGGHAPRSAGPSSPPPPQLDDLGGRDRLRLRVDDVAQPHRRIGTTARPMVKTRRENVGL
jgi:hypothetical protein